MFQKDILLPGELKVVSEENNKGVYEIDGLYPGYGHTLGNSLRRIILSSIPGIAVTRVFVDGVAHEFTTIDGVKEDVINIVLNLKRVVFKLDSTDDSMMLTLKTDKGGKITAKDITLPTQVEVINPDQYLFTIEKGKKVKIEFEITKGLGYVAKEDIKQGKLAPGEIIMDSSFTPIRRVSYDVTSTRVGDRTDFNKIMFKIETDGSITPTDVIRKSVQIMIDQLSAILGIVLDDEVSRSVADSIVHLDLDESLLEKLAKEGILNVTSLEKMTDDDIISIDSIENDDLKKIKKALKKIRK